jgi:hypothetical protein
MGNISLMAQETTPEANVNFADVSVVNAYITASTNAPLLGEPFTMTIIAEMPSSVSLQEWVTLDQSLYPLEILSQGDVQSATNNEQTTYQQTLNAVLWTVGDYITPELRLTYIQDGTLQFSPIRSLALNIPSSLAQSASTDLRPSRQPVDLPYLPPYVLVIIIFLLSSVVYALWRLLKKRDGRVMGIFGGDATQVLLAELDDLKHQSLPHDQIYLLVAEKIRAYIQTQLPVNATEMTTRELVHDLRDTQQLPIALLRELQTILDQADLVKFAQFEPDTNTTRYISFAMRWVQHIHQYRQNNVANRTVVDAKKEGTSA